MDNEIIEITKGEYAELIQDSKILNALIAYGVDNWEGYTEAMESVEND